MFYPIYLLIYIGYDDVTTGMLRRLLFSIIVKKYFFHNDCTYILLLLSSVNYRPILTFFKMLPNRAFKFTNEKCLESKMSLYVQASMTGKKMKL